jgi:hypothetical protein
MVVYTQWCNAHAETSSRCGIDQSEHPLYNNTIIYSKFSNMQRTSNSHLTFHLVLVIIICLIAYLPQNTHQGLSGTQFQILLMLRTYYVSVDEGPAIAERGAGCLHGGARSYMSNVSRYKRQWTGNVKIRTRFQIIEIAMVGNHAAQAAQWKGTMGARLIDRAEESLTRLQCF